MFRKIDEKTYASPQIEVADIAEASALGIGLIINNRPEDESPDQTPGAVIEAAASAAGIAYVAIPVTHAGFSMPQVEAMGAALAASGRQAGAGLLPLRHPLDAAVGAHAGAHGHGPGNYRRPRC